MAFDWNSKLAIALITSTISGLFSIAKPIFDYLKRKLKGEPQSEIEILVREAEEKGAAKNEVKILKKELEKTRKLVNECKKEKRRISNESQQLDIMLAWHELSREERKSIIDKNISSQEWMKNDEVKDKLHEIGERRKKCKDCSHCNNPPLFTFPN